MKWNFAPGASPVARSERTSRGVDSLRGAETGAFAARTVVLRNPGFPDSPDSRRRPIQVAPACRDCQVPTGYYWPQRDAHEKRFDQPRGQIARRQRLLGEPAMACDLGKRGPHGGGAALDEAGGVVFVWLVGALEFRHREPPQFTTPFRSLQPVAWVARDDVFGVLTAICPADPNAVADLPRRRWRSVVGNH